jgi:hypothetical protein
MREATINITDMEVDISESINEILAREINLKDSLIININFCLCKN